MSLPQGITAKPLTVWPNRHENFEQPLTPGASFKLQLPALATAGERYQQTTKNMQWLIGQAIAGGFALRAIGNNWSFTKVGVSDGGIIDTVSLKQTKALNNTMVAPAYLAAGKSAKNLFLTQCGMKVLELETILEARGKSLRASGASNAQTIAGALSTGTHGAAYKFGAVQDQVVGLHLVCGPNRHVWLERASYPVAGDALLDWMGQPEVLRNDELFNAVLVSFGSFGFIHGVLLETEDLFWLKGYSKNQLRYDAPLKKAMTALDFSDLSGPGPNQLNLPMPEPGFDSYHFQVIVNPHQFDLDDPGASPTAYVRLLYKAAQKPIADQPMPNSPDFTYGDSTLGLIQTVLDRIGPAAPLLVPPLVNQLYPLILEDTNGVVGTMSEFFGNSNIRGKASSAAIGVSAENSVAALEEIIRLHRRDRHRPFPGVVALRWVRKTPALLGFTRFETTCVIELDGVTSDLTNDFFRQVWNRLEEIGISYTMHWGKINFDLTEPRLRAAYSPSVVDSWLLARQQLLDAPTRAVFTNEFMRQCGLDRTIPMLAPAPSPILV
jgi:hypothetical protein